MLFGRRNKTCLVSVDFVPLRGFGGNTHRMLLVLGDTYTQTQAFIVYILRSYPLMYKVVCF